MTENEKTRTFIRKIDGGVFIGVMFVSLGLFFLMGNLNLLYMGSLWSYWPFILVIWGIQKMTMAYTADSVGSGAWLIFLGLWLYVSIQHVWGLDFGESWPALLIAWGLGMIWRSFGRPWPFLRKEKSS